MARFPPFALAVGLLARYAESTSTECVSYGMDFQNGGSYFQNSLSSDDFTFVSRFDGCEDDTAYNILVDTVGDQMLCTDTNLRPDDTDQLSTCPIAKSDLTSGNWSVIIMSNNGGDGYPIAYERDFTLSVGPQSTSTYTPTVTVPETTVPVVNTTTTITSVLPTTLPPATVTSPSATITPTTTVTPRRVTTTSTKYILTVKLTSYTLSISQATQTATASCILPTKPWKNDPVARIRPTVGPLAHLFTGKVRREELEYEKERYVEERAARLALVERAPDPQPLVVTDTDTSHWTTVTSAYTAPAVTATITTEETSTSTVTPAPVTVLKGKTIASRVTVTAPTPTKTVTRYAITTSVVTKTISKSITITSTTTPDSVKESCTSAGGILW